MKSISQVLILLTVIAGFNTQATADPIPLQADTLWSLSLDAREFLIGPRWSSNNSFHLLVGIDSNIVEIRDGEIVRRTEPFDGKITAIERAENVIEGEPAVFIGYKIDSTSWVSLLDYDHLLQVDSFEVGRDVYEIIDSSEFGVSFSETIQAVESLRWIGGEERVLLVGKEFMSRSQFGTGYGESREGLIEELSLNSGEFLGRLTSGYKHLMIADVDQTFLVSSSWMASGCGWYAGSSEISIHKLLPEISESPWRVIIEGSIDSYYTPKTEASALEFVARQDDSDLLAASVERHSEFRESLYGVVFLDPEDLSEVALIETGDRTIESLVNMTLMEEEATAPLLVCFERGGTVRFISPETLELLEGVYISPVGSEGVTADDYDNDGVVELVGFAGDRLTAVALRPLGIEDRALTLLPPSSSSLSASPNPFNSSVTINYSVGQVSKPVSLAVYDTQGRLVADLSPSIGDLNRRSPSGEQKVVWEAGDVPAGVYVVCLETQNIIHSQKLVLMK